MKLIKVKKDSDFALPGIDIEITRVDGYVSAVSFSKDGKLLAIIGKENYSEIAITIPAPPKMKTIYRLNGVTVLLDIPFSKDFDSREEAEENLQQVKDTIGDGVSDLYGRVFHHKIEEIQVEAE